MKNKSDSFRILLKREAAVGLGHRILSWYLDDGELYTRIEEALDRAIQGEPFCLKIEFLFGEDLHGDSQALPNGPVLSEK